MKRWILAVLFFALCGALFLARPARAQEDVLKQADAAWNEKSYARALELYRKALAQGQVRDREEVEYRIAVSLGKTQKWDEALVAANALLGKTEWKARIYYWLGRLHVVMPHQGYKVGDKIYRGQDYPKIEGAEKPQQQWLGEEDAKATLDYFEKAKIQAQQEREWAKTRRYVAPIHPLAWDEEIDLNFDLAAYLPQREQGKFIEQMQQAWKEKRKASESVDLAQPYDPQWNLPRKVLYLYNEIRTLDAGDKSDTVRSLLAKGLFVRAYRQYMDNVARWYDEEKKQHITREYPFDHMEAIPIWREAVDSFPKSPLADRILVLIAQTHQQKNDLIKALATYRELVQEYPKSKWASDARAQIQQITRREVSIDTMGQQKPGEAAKITVNTRNVKNVKFSAFRVQLEKVLAQDAKLNSPEVQFTEWGDNFGNITQARQFFGEKVAEWNFDTKDKGDYQGVYETLDTPIKDLGAYAIVGETNGVRTARILIISDLSILKKTSRDTALAYIADARSGAPVNGVNVILKERYYQNNNHRVSVVKGQSGEVGFFDKKLTRGPNIYSQQVEAFAWIGNRYALTGAGYYGYWGGYDDNREEAKVYSYTDRPVYRPGQKVYFRQILTRRVGGGDQEPLKGVTVNVQVTNPKGEKIYEKKITSSEFGTINGDFMLPAETPLGEYGVQAYVEQTARNIAASGGNRFRVEEYKRPEFIVNVDAPDIAVKPGETVAAKINAKYYFGSPVPNATVKYTVRRSTWWANYRFPRPYEWLYTYWGVGDYNTGRRNVGGEGSGEIIKEGTVKTDAQGNAEVTFQTKREEVNENDWWARYSNPLYTIEAEVTDASRRTIEGQGQVRVANQQYFAFLNAKQGYYLSGDRVQIEIITQDANDKPQSASGKMVVYKLLPNDKEEKVFEEAIRTDEKGRAVWTWPTDNAGQFRIAWESTDDWGNKVVGSTNIWVAGPGLNTTQFRLQGVTIVLDKRNYEEGDTAKVLLVADQPGSTVLLTQEAGGEILRRDVVFIEGKNKQISIPIEHKHVPNFAIAAAMVRNFQVYQAQEEVFVPPTKQFLNISVTGDKTEYKPGEKGTFTIAAKDWKGNPARAEVSVAMVDASLFYIQKDYAPDVRLFYYGERRANSVNLDSSRSGQPQAHTEDDQKYENYEQHGWEQPDEMGLLNLPVGQFGWYRYNRSRRGEMDYFMADGAMMSGVPMPAMPAVMSPRASNALRVAESAAGGMGGGAPMAKMAATGDKRDAGGEMQLATAQVRSNFAETAFWSPAVVTEGGTAKVEVTFPDSLTQWHATARGLTPNVQVGSGEADVETKKNLLVRLQAPRFFVERDQVVLTANVHNYLKSNKRVKVSLDLGSGLEVDATPPAGLAEGELLKAASGWIDVKAGEEARVNWVVGVTSDGQTSVQMTAQTDEDADAAKLSFPVLVHGVQRFASQSGVLKGGQNAATATINLPKERRWGASSLNVQLNPSIAATMMDALPYLADYPYGCVEQTLSRFLPTALVQKTLADSGVNLQTLKARAQAYEKESKEAPIGERVKNTGYTYPKGQPNSRDLEQMASRLWWSGHRSKNPVYDQAEVNRMTQEGLTRLYNMQRGDGGWGWWPGSPQSDEYMSAYVMWGLATARAAEIKVRDDVINRGFSYLDKQMSDEDNLHLLTWMGHALSLRGRMGEKAQNVVSGRLFQQRERLTPYSQSLLAIALYNIGERDKAGVMVRNLENTALVDEANNTARWKMGRDYWWWWNNDVETNAWALKAFLLVDPKNALVDRSMKWLVTQSRGNHWRSTKETAMAVSALNDYVRVNKELDVDYTLIVTLNDRIKRTYRVTSENMLFFDNRFITGDLFLENGANKVTIEKQGRGNLYWSAASEYFSLEEPIKASGNAIKIRRRYFKLTRNPEVKPQQGDGATTGTTTTAAPANASRRIIAPRPVPAQPAKPEFIRTEIKDNATLQSGDLIEVELTLDADNDYSYLVFEDMKAAGLEPVDLRSGYAWGDGLSSNVELRDEKVALFVDYLPQGTRVLRYRMRAEIPGRFHALPTNGYAMYAPEVRAISDEQRLGVKD
jgi:alpha-2-macroglobulin